MRQRRNGHVFFVTSMGGLRTFPGLSAYHGSKFALEGIAATIAQEVAPFGIHVSAVESSSFRTDWAGRSMTRVRRTITDTSYSAATPFASSPRHEPSLTRKQRGGRSCRYPRTTRPDGRSRARRECDDCRCARTDRVSTRTTARGRGRPRHRADSQPGSRYRGQPDGSSSRPVRPRARSSDSSRSMAASSASRFMPRHWACSLSSRTGLRIRPDHQLPCFSGDGVIPFRQHFEPATEAPAGRDTRGDCGWPETEEGS
jgi:hypothetical protein